MKSITHKSSTERSARAAAFLAIDQAILAATEGARSTDKGDALEASRIAGIMAVKRTAEALPFCHPIPITDCDVVFEVRDDGIYLEVSATTIAATGVEMESLYAAGVAAMNLYDMLKPHAPKDTGLIAVTDVHLVEKQGGKSDFAMPAGLSAAIVITHDGIAAGDKEDQVGQTLQQMLEDRGIGVAHYAVVGNEVDAVEQALEVALAEDVDLVATVGGTGMEARDCTVACVERRLQRRAPGVMEAARAYGQARTPLAMLSNGVAGKVDDTWVVTFPGSTNGARQTAQAILTGLGHAMSDGC